MDHYHIDNCPSVRFCINIWREADPTLASFWLLQHSGLENSEHRLLYSSTHDKFHALLHVEQPLRPYLQLQRLSDGQGGSLCNCI